MPPSHQAFLLRKWLDAGPRCSKTVDYTSMYYTVAHIVATITNIAVVYVGMRVGLQEAPH